MKKLNVAVIFGGCSSEYGVSLQSAAGVIGSMDKTKFEPVLVGITREGDWYHYEGGAERIASDTWLSPDCSPAALSPSRSRHELIVFRDGGTQRIPIDAAFPVLHGKNGEDGTVQGLCELAGIPLAGCGTLASALCMDKFRAHALAALAGVRVPRSVELSRGYDPADAQARADALGWPLFVKPVKAGSSYGVAKIASPDALDKAVKEAFRYDDRVLLEENIEGFEVGCAVMGQDEPVTGELDEIELAQGFFDFTEKYNLITSKIHVPARVSAEKSAELKAAARAIYKALGCSGFARVDMFLTPKGEIVFNEVNTIPGFTAHSRFPSMMRAAGVSPEHVITSIIETAVAK